VTNTLEAFGQLDATTRTMRLGMIVVKYRAASISSFAES
jgi:hypothetical protein